jgi:hypothetical protein
MTSRSDQSMRTYVHLGPGRGSSSIVYSTLSKKKFYNLGKVPVIALNYPDLYADI